MPDGADVRDGILKGIYRFKPGGRGKGKLRAQLIGSGAILPEVHQGAGAAREKYDVRPTSGAPPATTSCTATATRASAGTCCIPAEAPRVPYVTQCARRAPRAPIVAASDYLKVLPDAIDRWLPRPLRVAGHRRLRPQREIARRCGITSKWTRGSSTVATLAALAPRQTDRYARSCSRRFDDLEIDPEKVNPAIA